MSVRTHLESLPPYIPIEPFEVLAARSGRAVHEIIKLDANENPYGPLPAVREALGRLEFPHIYPDPESRSLRAALAAFTGVPAQYLMAGAGADELIDLLMRVVLEPGNSVITCPPTFGMYEFDARLNAAEVIEIRRRPDYSIDVDAIESAVATHSPKLLFIASPNNPDGSMLDQLTLRRLLDLPVILVLDEAYVEFAGEKLGADQSQIVHVPDRENLIVLRTFSKWAGLAGLRVGYGAFPAWLMPTLWKAKQPYNVSVAASIAAQVSLEHTEELTRIVALLQQERERLCEMLQGIEYLQAYPTCSNFVLCRVTGREAADLKQRLADGRGIFVRHFNKPGLADHIRVSVGRPQDTDALIAALKVV